MVNALPLVGPARERSLRHDDAFLGELAANARGRAGGFGQNQPELFASVACFRPALFEHRSPGVEPVESLATKIVTRAARGFPNSGDTSLSVRRSSGARHAAPRARAA